MSFDYIDHPPKLALEEAVETLRLLGAVNTVNNSNQLSDVGKKMAKLPVEPRVSQRNA